MSDLAVMTAGISIALGQEAPSGRVGDESSKPPFRDMPALASIRQERKSEKKRTGGESGTDSAYGPGSDPAQGAQGGRGNQGVRSRREGPRVSSENTGKRAGETVKGDALTMQGRGPKVAGRVGDNAGHRAAGMLPFQVTGGGGHQLVGPPAGAMGSGWPTSTTAQPHGPKAILSPSGGVVKQSGGMADADGVVAASVRAGGPREAVIKSRTPHAERPDGRVALEKAVQPARTAEEVAAGRLSAAPADKQPQGDALRMGLDAGTAAGGEREPPAGLRLHRRAGHPHVVREAGDANSGRQAQSAATPVQGSNAHLPGLTDGVRERADAASATGNDPAVLLSRLSTPALSTPTVETATLRNAAQSVSEQIASSVRAGLVDGGKEILVRLNPPELGSVTVRFQELRQEIRAVLEVVRNETRQEVERAIPEVLRTLQEAGVQIRRVEVVLSDPSGRDISKDQPQQDAGTQQQTSQQHADQMTQDRGQRTEGRDVFPDSPFSGLRPAAGPDPDHADPRQFAPSSRIDMLM